ncbi:lysophospholipid acyltransferase family protein [Aquimarina rhabdastrellae]
MQLFIYCLAYPFLWIISRLPWRLFYAFSTSIYILVYYVIGYRRKTVTENLKLVFPEKSDQEIKIIRKTFYKHMCDMFLEMIKSMSITNDELLKRFHITNIEVLKELEAKQKSIVLLVGHYASYEWAIVAQLLIKYPSIGVYKQIKNPYFDRLVRRIRAKYNTQLVTSYNAMKKITKNENDGNLAIYGMVSDQSPRIHKAFYWTDFMGIKVPAFLGGEVLAKRFDLAVVYLNVEKKKRGHYEASFIPITESAGDCEDYFIVKKYLSLLENQIRKAPAYYLWTHKRWKHRNATPPKGATID